MKKESTYRDVLSTAVGSLVFGGRSSVQIRGNHRELSTLSTALNSTAEFQKELDNPSATVESVMNAYKKRALAAQDFEGLFGVSWPL